MIIALTLYPANAAKTNVNFMRKRPAVSEQREKPERSKIPNMVQTDTVNKTWTRASNNRLPQRFQALAPLTKSCKEDVSHSAPKTWMHNKLGPAKELPHKRLGRTLKSAALLTANIAHTGGKHRAYTITTKCKKPQNKIGQRSKPRPLANQTMTGRPPAPSRLSNWPLQHTTKTAEVIRSHKIKTTNPHTRRANRS